MRLPAWTEKYRHLLKGSEDDFAARLGLQKGEESWMENSNSAEWKYEGEEPIKTLPEALAKCKADLGVWQVRDWTYNTWTVTAFPPDHPKGITRSNHQVKIWFKPVKISEEKLAEWLEARIKDKVRAWKPPILVQNKLVVSINIFDAHVDKLTSIHDTLLTNLQRFEDCFDRLLSRVEANTIYFPVGNDFFNSNAYYKTAAGTDQQNNSLEHECFEMALDVLVRCIDKAAQKGNVVVPIVQGNHDKDRIFYAGTVLARLYKGTNVKVDNEYNKLKIYREDKVLLAYHHGDRFKSESISNVIAADNPEAWAFSVCREIFFGHEHHEKSKELPGCTARWMKTMSKSDQWSKDNLYRNIPGVAAYVYSMDGWLYASVHERIYTNFTTNLG